MSEERHPKDIIRQLEQDAEKHLTQALAAMDASREQRGRDDPKSRDLSIAITEAENAYLRLVKDW